MNSRVSSMELQGAHQARAGKQPINPLQIVIWCWFGDVLVIGAIGLAVFLIYPQNALWRDYLAAAGVGMFFFTLYASYFQVYRVETFISRPGKFKEMVKSWVVAWLTVVMLAVLLKTTGHFSRIWMVGWLIGGGIGLTLWRLGMEAFVGELARNQRFRNRAVIFGANDLARQFLSRHEGDPMSDAQIIGLADDRAAQRDDIELGLPVLCNLEGLVERVRHDDIQIVFVALPWSAQERRRKIVSRLTETPVQVRVVSGAMGLDDPLETMNWLGDLAVFGVRHTRLKGWSVVAKACFDRPMACLLLCFSAPLMLLITMAVKLDSPGPVFFKQVRRGFNNNRFAVYKFRSLYTDHADREARSLVSKDDPRITRVGRFLRRTSLDELPQLFNVVKGDMSLVGPRPHAPSVLAAGRPYEEVVERYIARYNVKPGMTGLAQISGYRGETDTVDKIRNRVACDMAYIRDWSIWLDVKILFLTIPALLKGENAY